MIQKKHPSPQKILIRYINSFFIMSLFNHMTLFSDHHLERQKFSPEEDKVIKDLVAKFGIKAWSRIATHLPGRTPRQCRERYVYYLQPHLVNGPWTEAEEQLLKEKYYELGPKWAKIASFFESRSDVNLKNHWAAMKRRNTHILNAHIDGSQNASSPEHTEEAPKVFTPVVPLVFPNTVSNVVHSNYESSEIFGDFDLKDYHDLGFEQFDWTN